MSSLLLLGVGTDASAGGGGGATVAFDAVTMNNTDLTTPLSWTHTPVGTPTGVVVGVCAFGGGGYPTGITYGGVAMTQLVANINTDRVSLWGLPNPGAGAKTVTVTWASAPDPVCFSMTVTGSDLATIFRGTGSTAIGTSTSASLTNTDGLTGDLMVAVVDSDNAAPTLTAGGTVTQKSSGINGGISAAIGIASGTTSWTPSWSVSPSSPWVLAVAAIKHA